MKRQVARILAAAAVCLPATVASTATGGGAAPACAEAAGVHHAALVVEHASGATVTVCVAFTADSVTGDQLLAMSHVQYATVDYPGVGKAVCQIDGEPSTYPPGCWTASSPYWAMFVSRGGAGWAQSGLGISSQTFRDGDAEGFRYEGQSDSSPPPSPDGVCPPPSTPTPVPAKPTSAPAEGVPATRSAAVGSAPSSAVPPASPSAAPASPVASPSPTLAAPVVQRSGSRPVSSSPAGGWLGWLAAAAAALLLLLGLGYRLVRSR